MEERIIDVAAALISDRAGRALMVRKHGTTVFMQPGGKPEPGEDALRCIVRELAEELSLVVVPSELTPLGTFEEAAANEPGHRVRAEVFALELDGAAPVAAAEIAEYRWFDPADPGDADIAPLSSRALLPLLIRR